MNVYAYVLTTDEYSDERIRVVYPDLESALRQIEEAGWEEIPNNWCGLPSRDGLWWFKKEKPGIPPYNEYRATLYAVVFGPLIPAPDKE